MPRKQPILKDLKIWVAIEPISAIYPARIITHGTMYMVRVPVDVFEYFSLQPGDTLNVQLLSVKRLRENIKIEE